MAATANAIDKAKRAFRPPMARDADLTVPEIIGAKSRHFNRLKSYHDSSVWHAVRVDDRKPIGVVWFGDPHIDDDGADIDKLFEHTELCRNTPGLYGANLGDVTNNWTGRLAAQYANQSTSVKRARKLARWFMLDSGVTWICQLIGNHDAWEQGGEILERIAAKRIPIHDWEARFKIVFPNRVQVKVHAAHDFKGNSQWNIGHGPMKAAMMGSEADILVCGHRHTGIVTTFEHGGRVRTVIRARGYKRFDRYAVVNGFPETDFAPSVMTIIDPTATEPGARIMTFADPATGARVLTALRGDKPKRKGKKS